MTKRLTNTQMDAARELARALKHLALLADTMGWKAPTAWAALARAARAGILPAEPGQDTLQD